MRENLRNIAGVVVSLVFSAVVLTGAGAFGEDRPAAGRAPHQPPPVRGAAHQDTAPQNIEVEVLKNLDGLHKSLCDKLARLAVDVLSGNAAHLLAENQTDLLTRNKVRLLSGNSAELLSGNCPKLLSGNETSIRTGNRISVLSDIKVEINIHINNSGNNKKDK